MVWRQWGPIRPFLYVLACLLMLSTVWPCACEQVAPNRVCAEEPPALVANTALLPAPVPRRIPPPKRSTTYPNTGFLPVNPPLFRLKEPEIPQVTDGSWEVPEALLERLDGLATGRATDVWAAQTGRLVRNLGLAVSEGSGKATSIIRRLDELARRAEPLAATIEDRLLAGKLRRAGHALRRCLDIWQEVVEISGPAPLVPETTAADPERLSLALAEIDALTGDSAEGKAWRKYLLLDVLHEWSTRRQTPDDRLLAQRVLGRLTQPTMSNRQRQFVSREPLVALRSELRRLAAEPVDSAELLQHIERYERTGLPSDARRLANDCLYLRFSGGEDHHRLVRKLQTHYRNANLRLAVTGELLNRLMPEREPEVARVRDTVVGVPVRGKSLTTTDVKVQLVPDPSRVRLALEVTGMVASLTSSTSGPATFYNDNQSVYIASKPMEIDLKGIHLRRAEVDVFNSTKLRGLKTNFDAVPLVGSLIKGVARSQHEQKRAAANREIKRKVAFKARKRIDSETDARLGELAERLRERVFGPLETLALDPTMIDARTTDRRFTMRLRLAGEDQLGGNTPRPRAPGNSLASFQLHESAISNVLDRLQLDGRTFTLPELSRYVAGRLGRPQFWQTNPGHDDVEITFAKNDAVTVRLRDGRIALTLSITRLSKSPRRWKNFQVRAFYRPRINGCNVQLARDGVIHLIGRRLSARSQIALRGIFSKTFSRKHPIDVTPERLADNPKLADLEVTQFVIDDGWIGAALGPKQTALRSRILRR